METQVIHEKNTFGTHYVSGIFLGTGKILIFKELSF